MLLLSLMIACQTDEPEASGRTPGERAPLSAECDDADSIRCLLPWPSNVYTVEDETTPTGLRLSVAAVDVLEDEDLSFLNTADGFSRLSPVITGFALSLDPNTLDGAIQVFNAQPDHPDYGQPVGLLVEMVEEPAKTLLQGFPQVAMAENADHVAVVMNTLTDDGGAPVAADRHTRVALGLDEPGSTAEQALADYHAPTRALLDDAGVDLYAVARVWDFTTRSDDAMMARLKKMTTLAQDAADGLSVVIDSSTPSADPNIAAVVMGRLQGVPQFFDGERITFGEDGLPVPVGEREVVFRAVLPADPPLPALPVLYGHGMGGDVTDSALDDDLAAEGVVKINLAFEGWGGVEVVTSFAEIAQGVGGTSTVVYRQMQSLTNAAAIRTALDGPLALALEDAGGFTMATDDPIYLGGSLGGISGAVLVPVLDDLRYAVLNVPGGCWSQMMLGSDYYKDYLRPLLVGNFGDMFDVHRIIAMEQSVLDDMDGAAWGGALSDDLMLLQESIGDPIVPNIATEILARSIGASSIGPTITEDVNLPVVERIEGVGVGLTQFRIDSDSAFTVHGFADTDTDGGAAARAQIYAMGDSIRDGQPEINLPVDCDPNCDFGR
ncbi:MAG: hypothetical protein AAFV53_03915 [Myxococcota bacterium]